MGAFSGCQPALLWVRLLRVAALCELLNLATMHRSQRPFCLDLQPLFQFFSFFVRVRMVLGTIVFAVKIL